MNKSVIAAISAVLGISGGFAGGLFLAKKKYEDIADKEVESVKKSLTDFYETKKGITKSKKTNNTIDGKVKNDKNEEPSQTKTVEKYTDYSKPYRSPDDKRVIDVKNNGQREYGRSNPYVISPHDFEVSSNKTVTLWYSDDNVLYDDDGNEIRHYADMIGEDALSHFGEYEDDSVYVRNDVQGIDYEILLDHKIYYKTHGTSNFVVPEDVEGN